MNELPGKPMGNTPGDQRDRVAAKRDAVLEAREHDVAEREGVEAHRAEVLQRILTDADGRDERASNRDRAADKRELAPRVDELAATDLVTARGFAVLDRSDARADRVESKRDRSKLTDLNASSPTGT